MYKIKNHNISNLEKCIEYYNRYNCSRLYNNMQKNMQYILKMFERVGYSLDVDTSRNIMENINSLKEENRNFLKSFTLLEETPNYKEQKIISLLKNIKFSTPEKILNNEYFKYSVLDIIRENNELNLLDRFDEYTNYVYSNNKINNYSVDDIIKKQSKRNFFKNIIKKLKNILKLNNN